MGLWLTDMNTAEIYSAIKHAHMLFAATSIGLFLLRGALALRDIPWRTRFPILRWLPHANDTLLLGTAIALAVISHQYPITHHWLTAKVVMLVVYILMGKVALQPVLSKSKRAAWLIASLACFSAIVYVAVTRSIVTEVNF